MIQSVFIGYGFDGSYLAPHLLFLEPGAVQFTRFHPRGQAFTLQFDTAQRFCTGWHDLALNQSFPCPDAAKLPSVYEQCHRCRRKTGFNPAFYNASSVSPQQQARNAQPHLLYLAHFGPGVIKVGISWAGRGIRRLLEQGARSALVLATFPTADIARAHEAAIARLPGIAETVQARKKQQLLAQPYEPEAAQLELIAARERLVTELSKPGLEPLELEYSQPEHLDAYYLQGNSLRGPGIRGATMTIQQTTRQSISGLCLGMVGDHLVCAQQDDQFVLGLSKLKGYPCRLEYRVQENVQEKQIPVLRQTSLF